MNPTIYNSMKFLEDNLVDDKSKNMLKDVYDRYGFYYMLGSLGDNTNTEDVIIIGPPIEDDNYVPTSFVDVSFRTGTGSQNLLILNGLSVVEFSSVRYVLSRTGNSSVLFRFLLDPYFIEFVDDGINYYDGSSTRYDDQIKIIRDNYDIQFNFGYTIARHLIVELFVNGSYVGLWDLNDLLGSFVDAFAGSASFRLGMTGASSENVAFIEFYRPTSEYVTSNFLSYFNI